MFPYFDTTQWHVGVWSIHPFIICVVLGYLVSYLIIARRLARDGISSEQCSELGLWVLGVGFACASLVSLAYDPAVLAEVRRHPTRLMHFFWGLSSFGGFAGGILGAIIFFRLRGVARAERLIFFDSYGFAIPFGWSIARVGCYLVHDHPGIRTSSLLGVRYPGGVRYDLALLEILFLLVLGATFLWLDRKPRARGFFWVVFLVPYGVFRFVQDPLHVDEAQYLGWTVDQIAATAMIALGLVFLMGIFRVECRNGIAT